ncbi:MAG: GNAT family N-acetyltransferase [Bacteroidales bacterium]|nr:GNAT family N-acetyltransferase [Bacteroidales bacterium]
MITDFTDKDYNELINLWNITGINTPGRGDNLEIIKQTLAIGGKMFMMFSDNQLIGSSWLTTDGRRLYLHHFCIHPDFQGRGLSKPLLQESLNYTKKLNQQIKLEVHQNNIVAKNLYINYGFKYLGDYEVYIIRNFKKVN